MSTAGELLVDIAACLCAEVNADDKMCFCGVIAGAQAAHDFWPDCTNDGMAWVRLAMAYPSVALGVADQSPGVNRKMLGLDIEIGMVRSYTPDDDGHIDETEYARMMVESTDDMQTLRRVISCCPALEESDFILGTWQPIGPTGLVYGGTWTLFSQVH